MSHTFYDSPEGSHPSISIDVTTDFVWFFQHTDRHGNEEDRFIEIRKDELPKVWARIGEYLQGET